VGVAASENDFLKAPTAEQQSKLGQGALDLIVTIGSVLTGGGPEDPKASEAAKERARKAKRNQMIVGGLALWKYGLKKGR
jgi:hypothetical protein